MAKLTKKQTEELERVLRNLERAEKYIFAPDTAVARRSHGTTTLDYIRKSDGKALYEVERAYGSDLTGLKAGIEFLRDFLNTKQAEVSE